MSILFRKPQRISITLNHRLYEQLLESDDLQSRSLSNLATFLLESALEHNQARQPGTCFLVLRLPVELQSGHKDQWAHGLCKLEHLSQGYSPILRRHKQPAQAQRRPRKS